MLNCGETGNGQSQSRTGPDASLIRLEQQGWGLDHSQLIHRGIGKPKEKPKVPEGAKFQPENRIADFRVEIYLRVQKLVSFQIEINEEVPPINHKEGLFLQLRNRANEEKRLVMLAAVLVQIIEEW